jgi:hypothetical protein
VSTVSFFLAKYQDTSPGFQSDSDRALPTSSGRPAFSLLYQFSQLQLKTATSIGKQLQAPFLYSFSQTSEKEKRKEGSLLSQAMAIYCAEPQQ